MSSTSAAQEEYVSRSDYERLQQDYNALQAALTKTQQDYSSLQLSFLWLRKHLFGRKSEKLDLNQLGLFDSGEALTNAAEQEDEIEVPSHTRQKHSGRKPLPKELPRERTEYLPKETHCSGCNKELKRIGEDVTEELDYVPAQLIVREHAKIKLACPCCKNDVSIGKLPLEVQPIERGRPGAGLITHIIVSKYCDHLPLNRLEQMFAREGYAIARQRMWDWLSTVADQFKSLHRELLKEILKYSYLQADETHIEIRIEDNDGKLFKGYLWAVHAPPNLVYFRYAPTRASEVPLDIFDGYEGGVQTDLYAGYNQVFLPGSCYRLGCFAHVRRKFIEKGGATNKDSNEIIKLIAKLYKVESEGKGITDDERLDLRQKKSLPLLEQVFAKIEELNQRLLPQHPLKEATEYALKQKEALMRYTTNGIFHIDNNAIERQIRPIAVGRKNYLFAGSHAGAEAAAIFYSLISTCKLNGVNPRAYFEDVIKRLPSHPAQNITELLPHLWKEKHSS